MLHALSSASGLWGWWQTCGEDVGSAAIQSVFLWLFFHGEMKKCIVAAPSLPFNRLIISLRQMSGVSRS